MVDGIQIGFLFFSFYGLLLAFGALGGSFLARYEAKRRGHDPEIVWDLIIWLMIAGIIGARLWHIFTPSPSLIAEGITTEYYFSNPWALIDTRKGGLGIPGAVIGGMLALFAFTRKRKLSFLEWADIAAPGLALGQAIGRWGNFVNQELYGAPTSLPWKMYIDEFHRLAEYQDQAYYHPLFLYESLWNLGNMFILLWAGRRYADRIKAGDLLLLYMVIYPLGRFLLDFLRLDAAMLGGVNANQTFMAGVAIFALTALFLRHRKK
ncbi:MAG: prolipoprotein diacylglyceryl transferase [Anaerolineae bacterium]|jgi:phosphatidylglycerol---prolipoprotein diacylglyceryl transferase|nr:prolipoprotein diacylglyceryl transferase [Anaerolineae bacterium]MBT7073146.1 prolipoprotein diacylglyceryl transferase [Anaerolineae bacterium]MBT7326628.1 prolipoprotein diacylglyceryl transferase [Anaerolineae bacterium]